MSMEESVHRSLRVLVSRALGTEWNITLEERNVPVEQRPEAVVAWISPATTERSTRHSMPQGLILRFMTLVVTAYPERGASARAATVRAERVASALLDMVEVGLDDPLATVAVSHPFKVPVYDFDTIPEAQRDVIEGPAVPVQHATVIDHSAQPIPDPQDDRLYSVVLTVRVRYYRPGRIRAHGDSDGPLAASVPSAPEVH